MKLHEMINSGDPPIQPLTSIAPYMIRECPEFVNKLQAYSFMGLCPASILTGMDVLVRYLQMYDMPDDIGSIIEEVDLSQ